MNKKVKFDQMCDYLRLLDTIYDYWLLNLIEYICYKVRSSGAYVGDRYKNEGKGELEASEPK